MNQDPVKPPTKEHLRMKITSWRKQSYRLFDYQSEIQCCDVETYFVTTPVSMFKNVECPLQKLSEGQSENNEDEEDNLESIAHLSLERYKNHTIYKLTPRNIEQGIDDPRLALYRSIRNNGTQTFAYTIRPGNILKFGRIELRVIQSRNKFQEVVNVHDWQQEVESSGHFDATRKSLPKEEGEQIKCKICLQTTQTRQNPLISPCLCKGSLIAIHFECLRMCINTKSTVDKNQYVKTYNFTKFFCELCKHPFPVSIRLHNRIFNMMKIEKPQKEPYIIFQSYSNQSHQNPLLQQRGPTDNQKVIYVVTGKEHRGIKIGRAHNSDLRVDDISVSRLHAHILFDENQFQIKDCRSKFGTLMRIDKICRFGTKESGEVFAIQNLKNIGSEKYISNFEQSFISSNFKLQFGRTLFDIDVVPGEVSDIDTESENRVNSMIE